MSGCRAPPFVGIPSASKLYFLYVDVFHDPLQKYIFPSVFNERQGDITPPGKHVNCKIGLWLLNGSAEIRTLRNSEPLSFPT